MKRILIILICLGICSCTQKNTNKQLRIIAIGAHPDDCDSGFGGTAALFAKMGYKVKLVSITNGDAGHQSMGGGVLAKRRRAEAKAAGKILGVEYDVLDNHDGELAPSLNIRKQVIRVIRNWKADVVICLRPNTYHPDHRNAGIAVQDAAYLVTVPDIEPYTPPLKKMPVYLYMQDGFQKPNPFSKDIAVDIDGVINQKIKALAAHKSQMFEWMPWLNEMPTKVPKTTNKRLLWLQKHYEHEKTWEESDLVAIKKWYPNLNPKNIHHVEFFETCEFGKQLSEAELKEFFSMTGKK